MYEINYSPLRSHFHSLAVSNFEHENEQNGTAPKIGWDDNYYRFGFLFIGELIS